MSELWSTGAGLPGAATCTIVQLLKSTHKHLPPPSRSSHMRICAGTVIHTPTPSPTFPVWPPVHPGSALSSWPGCHSRGRRHAPAVQGGGGVRHHPLTIRHHPLKRGIDRLTAAAPCTLHPAPSLPLRPPSPTCTCSPSYASDSSKACRCRDAADSVEVASTTACTRRPPEPAHCSWAEA